MLIVSFSDSGVVYLAGHGFEHHGNLYLLGVDAASDLKIEDCLCLKYIITRLQACDADLLSVFVDICRTYVKNYGDNS